MATLGAIVYLSQNRLVHGWCSHLINLKIRIERQGSKGLETQPFQLMFSKFQDSGQLSGQDATTIQILALLV